MLFVEIRFSLFTKLLTGSKPFKQRKTCFLSCKTGVKYYIEIEKLK